MKYLSRNDLETIGGRVIAAYKRLPAISDQALERVDIDSLCQELLDLRIDYARLSLNGEKIGLTSSCDIGVEVFPEDPSSTEEQYYMLDGKTILIAAIQESTAKDNGEQNRLEQIQAIIAERESKCMEYDDSIVRQMVECIKVYPGGKLEIIFGGGYLVEESV